MAMKAPAKKVEVVNTLITFPQPLPQRANTRAIHLPPAGPRANSLPTALRPAAPEIDHLPGLSDWAPRKGRLGPEQKPPEELPGSQGFWGTLSVSVWIGGHKHYGRSY